MKKTSREKKPPSDALAKHCAREFDLSKKILIKAVREAKLRAVAERIAREEIDSSWSEILDRIRPTGGSPEE